MTLPTFYMVDGAPQPTGPFCHAAEIDGWVFLTGQTPLDPRDPSAPIPEGIEAQTHLVFQHLKTVLSQLGLGFDNVLRVGVYLTHLEEDFYAFNQVYKSYFPEGKLPARTCVGVTSLVRGPRVEVDLVAHR
ncbi:MAG: RidA family protein [Synechococcales cyanobacterium]